MRWKGISLLLSVALAACEPTGGETFLKAPRRSYDFTVYARDTVSAYDFTFYTRTDADTAGPLRLHVVWCSSDSSTVSDETVYLPSGRGGVFPYRKGVVFPTSGQWTISVEVSPQSPRLSGIGLQWATTN